MDSEQRDQLIAKHLGGQTDHAGEVALQNWRDAAPENEALFRESKTVWESAEAQQPPQPFDVDRGWRTLSQRMQAETISATEAPLVPFPKQKANRRWFLGLAASFFIGFSLLFIYQQNRLAPTILEATDGILVTELPDGSKIHLQSGSQLAWLGDISQGARKLNLKGQALFEVAKNGETFVVKTEVAKVEVLGTKFSVRSYGERTEVFVVEGRVSLIAGDFEPYILDIGNVGQAERNQDGSYTLQKSAQKLEDNKQSLKMLLDDHLHWLDGGFYFEVMPLVSVADELSRRFDEPVVLADPELHTMQLTGTFDEMELEKILEEISLTLQLKYQPREQGGYILSTK
jgi:ferric-dicitrate binding protein FerR (iron transport regulator)